MKNHNVYNFNGDIEKAIKNGDLSQIILFDNIKLPICKFLNSFINLKNIEKTIDFPYNQSLLKFRSPFRIGERNIRLIYLNAISEGKIDKQQLSKDIKNICKKFKNSISLLPIQGALIQYENDILECLETNTVNTKIVILN